MITFTNILAIDIGNTQCKIAIMQQAHVIEKYICTHATLLQNIEKINATIENAKIIVCNVVESMQETVAQIEKTYNAFKLHANCKLPFASSYTSMQTLGLDRIALIAAASAKFKNQNTLVIALGTCITYNFLNAANIFEGGAIAPGMHMRFKAMHHFTKGLPLIADLEKTELVGQNTLECMQSGVQNGIIAELNGIIEVYTAKYKNLNVVLTGGDMLTFATQIKCKIFADENFQFQGLYEMLQYNTN